jgi:hypothetical protein
VLRAFHEIGATVPFLWPGTARSAASAGRWLIMISGEMKASPRPRVRALGIRNTRRGRRRAVSSRRNALDLESESIFRLIDSVGIP